MARNRQRAKDRKRRNQDNGQPDEAEGVVRPSPSKDAGAGAPPSDVDLDNDFDDEDDDPVQPDPVAVVGTTASTPVRKQQGSKLINFLRACWAELQRVQWPDRRQVGQATAVVLGFVLIAGAFLGLADVAAKELVDLIL